MPSKNNEQNQRDLKNEPGGLGCSTGKSPSDGADQDSIYDSDCQGTDSSAKRSTASERATTLGKILEQLQELQIEHLKYVDAHRSRLQARLNESDEHRKKIVAGIERLQRQVEELLSTPKPE